MNVKFLIVDAHPVFVMKTIGFLGSMSLKSVELVNNGAKAKEIFLTKKPDVVILSATLPEVESLNVLESIKSVSPSTPFIVQTGLLTDDARKEAFKSLGADFVIPRLEKDWSLFEDAVQKILQRLSVAQLR